MRIAGFVVLSLLSLGVSGYAIVAYGFLPFGVALHPEIRKAFEAERSIVCTHAFAAAFALALGPLQFVRGLRARRPGVHRWTGRLYLGVGVLVGGLSGLAMAFRAYGGIPGRLGFGALAAAWLFTGLLGLRAIRAGEVGAHRRWMVRNFALTFAAVTLRLWVPLSVVAGVPFDLAYPVIAWLCWVPNLVLAELFLLRPRASTGAWRTNEGGSL